MATSITDLAEDLKFKTRLQRTPLPLTEDEYIRFIKDGMKTLFAYTQRSSVYDKTAYYKEDDVLYYPYDLSDMEEIFVLLWAQKGFYEYVANGVNDLFGYTTDAISVTNADKPYANISNTLNKIESEIRTIYLKMVDVTLPLQDD